LFYLRFVFARTQKAFQLHRTQTYNHRY
jgi:hypothetical protein